MSEIDELQRRITAAIERIGAGVDGLARRQPTGPDPEEFEAMRRALEEERVVNAQLEERIRKLHEKHAADLAAAAASAPSVQRLERLDTDLQRLRQANDQLRASNAALREANAAGVGEPHLINKAMLAELEALRAARAADVAEAGSIMAQLVPLLDRAKSLPEGEET